jgi:hypothetical protein
MTRDVVESFHRACDLAAEEAKRQPVSEEVARARRLLDLDVTIERAWAEVNAARERERLERAGKENGRPRERGRPVGA